MGIAAEFEAQHQREFLARHDYVAAAAYDGLSSAMRGAQGNIPPRVIVFWKGFFESAYRVATDYKDGHRAEDDPVEDARRYMAACDSIRAAHLHTKFSRAELNERIAAMREAVSGLEVTVSPAAVGSEAHKELRTLFETLETAANEAMYDLHFSSASHE